MTHGDSSWTLRDQQNSEEHAKQIRGIAWPDRCQKLVEHMTPVYLQARAAVFIAAHNATETNFVATSHNENWYSLLWENEEFFARHDDYGPNGWSVNFGSYKDQAMRMSWCDRPPTRRSHDFAEFLERFRV